MSRIQFLIAILLLTVLYSNCSSENFTDLTDTKVIENVDYGCPQKKETESVFEYNLSLSPEEFKVCEIVSTDGEITIRRKRE